MSTLKSDNSDLTINADGSGKNIKFHSNGVEKASISSAGVMTATSFAGDGSALTGIDAVTSAASAPAVGTAGSLFYNTTEGVLHVSNGSSWAPVYEPVRDGSSEITAVRTAAEAAALVTSGPTWFDINGEVFQTYVDIDYNNLGVWALVSKQGAGITWNTGAYHAGEMDVLAVHARGDTNTTTVTGYAHNDSVGRVNMNSLFQLNTNAGIMSVDFIANGCNGNNTGHSYIIKKVTNRSSFDAFHGMWNNYIWGDHPANHSGTDVSGFNTAYRTWSTQHSNTDWNATFTDFTHKENSHSGWEAWAFNITGFPGGTLYTTRHVPIVSDWDTGCQWIHRFSSNSTYNSSGRVWVKL